MPNGMFALDGRVAVITGGNAGIGLGIAKGLGIAGATIVVAARDQGRTAKAVEALQALNVRTIGLAVDVQDESSVEAMVKTAVDTFGRVDILVNNAGVAIRNAPQHYSIADWNQVVSVNLTGMFICCREVYPHMSTAGGGKIINIGSMFSIFGSDVGAPYAASKGGVVQLTKSLAVAWAKDNVQVNAILPGWIHTELTAPIKTLPERYNAITARIPHGRWGEPDEIAGAAVFLASRASDYVTGITLPVDGGYGSK
jgi:2-dehydro-3-deoxy-D-gluconate 5-dehydrogenase